MKLAQYEYIYIYILLVHFEIIGMTRSMMVLGLLQHIHSFSPKACYLYQTRSIMGLNENMASDVPFVYMHT